MGIPMVIGVTGGIGSGKTTVCRVFRALGAPVYEADAQAKALMVTDAALVAAIKDAFGQQAYVGGGLDRAFLASQVFGQPERLALLNSLVHPAVARDFMAWLEAHRAHPYVVKEAAILFESGSHRAVSRSVLVTAPEGIRLQRVMQRDGASEAEVRQRMASQWPEERKAALADHAIVNDGHTLVLPQVLGLHALFSAGGIAA